MTKQKVLESLDADFIFKENMIKLLDATEAIRGLKLEHPLAHQIEALGQVIDDLSEVKRNYEALRTTK